MSTQLHTALTSILKMPYFKNETAKSAGAHYGHEEAVAIRIRDSGFTEQDKSLYPKLKKGLLKKWAETGIDADLRRVTAGMPQGTFILQPAGSQGFPDILVKDFGDRFVAIECKSGQSGLCPMWNDNLPKPDAIYVLSSGRLDETTVFMGQDVMTKDLLASQQAMIKEMSKIVDKYRLINKELDQFSRGWDTKFRPQNFQGGGNIKTNYFTHSDRKMCEENVLNFSLT